MIPCRACASNPSVFSSSSISEYPPILLQIDHSGWPYKVLLWRNHEERGRKLLIFSACISKKRVLPVLINILSEGEKMVLPLVCMSRGIGTRQVNVNILVAVQYLSKLQMVHYDRAGTVVNILESLCELILRVGRFRLVFTRATSCLASTLRSSYLRRRQLEQASGNR